MKEKVGQLLTWKNLLLFLGGLGLASLLFCFFILGHLFLQDKGEEEINLLILGEGGEGHAGAILSDMIVFSSISTKATTFISIPRDLWYTPWQTKINSVYYYGEQKGNGFFYTKEVMNEILGQKVDRVLIVDFGAFEDLVDLVGGVDIEVERAFDDYQYPIPGKENDLCDGDPEFACRYEQLHFEKGWQHMDGNQALRFVRSRYAEGEEGTDTARSYRQQKVLTALKTKFSSPKVFLSLGKVASLWRIFQKRIKSDLSRGDFFALIRILLSPQARKTQSFVLDGWQEEEGLFYHPQKHPSSQWVLLPGNSSWSQTHKVISCLLEKGDKSLCYPKKK